MTLKNVCQFQTLPTGWDKSPHVIQYTAHNVNILFTSTTEIFMAFSMVAMSTNIVTRPLNHAVSRPRQ